MNLTELIVITKILLYIKHNLRFVWWIIDRLNALLFSMLYARRMEKVLPGVFEEYTAPPYIFRVLLTDDADALFDLISNQEKSDLEYFKPHGFGLASIKKQSKNRAFLMMGTFEGDRLIGYFFLRFFTNRKCFVGRLIDNPYRGKGIGLVMNNIMYEITWRMKFRCLSTISRNNAAVMKAHARNPTMIILEELQNDYLLVEFVRKEPVISNQ